MVGGVETTTCPSCGWESVGSWSAVEPPLRASPECYTAYQELSAYNLLRARSDFLHQEAVDAYAAQHPGPPAKPIRIWFALVGLHLALDQGRSGREVQRAHMELGRRKRTWPILPAADDLRCTSAGDVMRHPPGDVRDDAVLSWATEVWEGWSSVHATIATLCVDEGL
jgi:hypothetical protein